MAFNATFVKAPPISPQGFQMPVVGGPDAQGCTALTPSASPQTLQRGGANWEMPDDGYLLVFPGEACRVAVGEAAATGASPVGHYVDTTVNDKPIAVSRGATISVIQA